MDEFINEQKDEKNKKEYKITSESALNETSSSISETEINGPFERSKRQRKYYEEKTGKTRCYDKDHS